MRSCEACVLYMTCSSVSQASVLLDCEVGIELMTTVLGCCNLLNADDQDRARGRARVAADYPELSD